MVLFASLRVQSFHRIQTPTAIALALSGHGNCPRAPVVVCDVQSFVDAAWCIAVSAESFRASISSLGPQLTARHPLGMHAGAGLYET